MRYSEQADLAAKAKRVMQSVTTKEQFNTADKYVYLAKNKIDSQEIMEPLLKAREQKYAEFYPASAANVFGSAQGQNQPLSYLWGESNAEQMNTLQYYYNRQLSSTIQSNGPRW